jgi:hypothetical protein
MPQTFLSSVVVPPLRLLPNLKRKETMPRIPGAAPEAVDVKVIEQAGARRRALRVRRKSSPSASGSSCPTWLASWSRAARAWTKRAPRSWTRSQGGGGQKPVALTGSEEETLPATWT